MTYHINPETGRPNICRASIRNCKYGSDSEHFDTKQNAQAYSEKRMSEEFGEVSTLTRSSKNSTTIKTLDEVRKELGVLSESKLYPLIKKRLKLSMSAKEIDKLLERSGGYESVSFYAYYNGNQEVSLQYDHHETVNTFTKGACALLAHELHRVTSMPLTVFTYNKNEDSGWTGHVALKLPNGEYFDINGPASRDSILSPFAGNSSRWTEEEMSPEDFKNLMGVDPETNPTDKLDPLEKAVLSKICFDLIKDYNLNDPNKAGFSNF